MKVSTEIREIDLLCKKCSNIHRNEDSKETIVIFLK